MNNEVESYPGELSELRKRVRNQQEKIREMALRTTGLELRLREIREIATGMWDRSYSGIRAYGDRAGS